MFKRILKGLLVLLLLIIGLVALVWFQKVDPRQYNLVENPHLFPDTLANRNFDIDSLKAIVGPDKGLPEGFELQALLAYAAYPELKEVKIDMVLTREGAPMESNFDIWSLFGSGRNRQYRVLLNNARGTNFDAILLHSLPFDAQVGILAHELGHVAYYHRLSTLQIAKWGLKYITDDDFRSAHEQSTDMMPVYHGLGSQIYQYAHYVRHDDCCTEMYESFGAEFMDKFYMTDKALSDAIKAHPLYNR